MFLKRLEIYGFKSFADRTHIEFDKGITSIVGPNGSGKSNIVDAIRWVLGEQSSRSLRGSKMEDVIFSGTETRRPVGFAEVSMTIDNTDGELPIDYSEVTITRRVFRSGEAEYYINRSPCRLKDILELFMDTGVGREGYSIIGQGRIDEILSTRPENRRRVFEEAAGIVKYKARREEAEKKLEKAQENIVRIDDILAELERQLEPLEAQSRIAREYLELKSKLKYYEINRFIIKYNNYTEKMDKLKEQICFLETDIQKCRSALMQNEQSRKELKQKIATITAELEVLKDRRSRMVQEAEKINGEIKLFQEKLNQVLYDNETLKEEIERERSCIVEKEVARRALVDELLFKEKLLKKSRELLKSLSMQLAEIQKELVMNQEEIEKVKKNTIDILSKIAECRSNATRYRTIEANLRNRLEQIHKSIKENNVQKNALAKDKQKLEERIQKINTELKKLEEEKDILKAQIEIDEVRLSKWERRLQKERERIGAEKSRLHLLLAMKNNLEGFSGNVKQVLQSIRQQPLLFSKICGVVADLIRVPEEYELAIEAALGSSLQFIITENEDDAKDIIEYLRTNRIGRATFLPISSMRPRTLSSAERQVLSMQGCRGVAVELVEFDPKYRSVFENLLGRVVVTENLKQAIQIARRFSYAFRIVTLEGDVINPGGSISGGSNRHRSVGVLSRNREILKLQNRISTEQAFLTAQLAKKEEFAKGFFLKEKRLKELIRDLRHLEMERFSEKEKLEGVCKEYEKTVRKLESLEGEAASVREEISRVENLAQNEEQQISQLERQSADIREVSENIEEYLKDIAGRREEMDRKIADIRVEITAREGEINALKDRIKRLDAEISLLKREIAKKERKVDENLRRQREYTAKMTQKSKEVEKFEKEIKEIDQTISEKEKEEKKYNNILKNVEMQLDELAGSVELLTEKKHRFELQLSRLEADLENLQNNIWEDYEISYSKALAFRDEKLSLSEVNRQIEALKERISKLGEVNVNSIEEYKRVKERYEFLKQQKSDLVAAEKDLKRVIRDITGTMEDKFIKEFDVINNYFQEVFRQLFGGGKARLILEDRDNVLGCGIDIIAQPPGKKLQSLSLLSGGEKALTAIALLFAILKRRPASFCVLDEIDAALDERNVYRFAAFLKDFSKNTQFIVVSHRQATMEASDALYGIAMEEKGVSRLVSVRLAERAG